MKSTGCALAGLICLGLMLASPPAQGADLRAPTAREATTWSALAAEAEAARTAGQWARLEQVSRKRLAIEIRTYGPDSAVAAVSYSWIGQALAWRGRERDAEAFYRRALQADRKALGGRHLQSLLATANLAGVLERQGRFGDAEPLRRELMAASQAVFGTKSAEAAAATVALADLLRAHDRPGEAELLYRAAAEADRQLFGETDPRRAADLGALAATLDDLGRHLEAEPLHRRALALRRQGFGEREAATAQAYARLALNFDAQGRHAEAEPLHRRALAIDQILRGERHPVTAADLAGLGANLDALHRSPEAEPLLRKALNIRRALLGEAAAETGVSYGALGANCERRGRMADAERMRRRALKIILAAKGPDAPATAAAYLALAGSLSRRARHAEAEPMLSRALEIRRRRLGEQHPATAAAYDALAENQRLLAGPARAEALSAQAVAIGRNRREADFTMGGSPSDVAIRRDRATREGPGEAQRPVLRRYLRLAWLAAADRPANLPRLRDAAFVAAQDLDWSPAARALAQTAGRAALGRSGGAADARLQQDLAAQVRQLEAQLARALPQGDADQAASLGLALDAVGRELMGLETRLQRDNPLYPEIVTPRSLSLTQAQRRLRPGEGLLLIVPAGGDVHVFAISRTKVAWNRVETGQVDLERRISALRCGIDDSACVVRPATDTRLAPFDLPLAYGLYRDLVAPVEGALAGVDQLFVTTSGAFGALPFGLLVTQAPVGRELTRATWLSDRYALTTLPAIASLRSAKSARAAPRPRWTFVCYGAPTSTTPGGQRATFVPLPGAAAELRAMARALGSPASTVRLGARATETAIKASADLSQAGVIAFATHGLLSREMGGMDEPGLILTPPRTVSARMTAS